MADEMQYEIELDTSLDLENENTNNLNSIHQYVLQNYTITSQLYPLNQTQRELLERLEEITMSNLNKTEESSNYVLQILDYLDEINYETPLQEIKEEITISNLTLEQILELLEDLTEKILYEDDDLNDEEVEIENSIHELLENISMNLETNLEYKTEIRNSMQIIEQSNLLNFAYLTIFVPLFLVTTFLYKLILK